MSLINNILETITTVKIEDTAKKGSLPARCYWFIHLPLWYTLGHTEPHEERLMY